MTDEQVEKIIKSNMMLQMNLAGIRADFEEALQRTWVGLTDEEVTTCHSLAVLSKKHDGTDPSFTTLLHRQIEAKLKEKNNG